MPLHRLPSSQSAWVVHGGGSVQPPTSGSQSCGAGQAPWLGVLERSPVNGSQASRVQSMPSSHERAVPTTQPDEGSHHSPDVQALPSSHTPSMGCSRTPVPGSQTSDVQST